MAPKFEEIQKGFQVTLYKAKLNEGVNILYSLIEKFPNKKTPFFAKELHTSVKNIERWIKELKADKKIEFVGAPKTGGYRALKKGN